MLGRGSEWRRWEPHIHAPGTVLNNQFSGPTAWEDYLTALEAATPLIEAVAVTDYYVTDTYEEVLRRRRDEGRLPNVQLVFPNVELRLHVAAKTGFVNMHLLVSPEDDDHVERIQRFLARLEFRAFDDRFDCTRSELIRLGRRDKGPQLEERAALEHGATQFKVSFDQLRTVWDEDAWARANVLIAVAGGSGDGTAGVREAADQVTRQEIERFAHVIFASSDAQRDFWLGRKALDEAALRSRYNGLKPCLHGSDAHKADDVGAPFGDRFSWIKGGLEFDALRQACIDPGGRAHVGAEPPAAATPSQVISSVRTAGADWIVTPEIQLNPGLVAIIGARGSGKTALADMIAAGCDAVSPVVWQDQKGVSASFLARARPLIGEETITVEWAGGDSANRFLDGRDANDPLNYPRARYLSQQFVEELCSSSGMTDALLREIERVIFEAHPYSTREGAVDFAELREGRTRLHSLARAREVEAIAAMSERIGLEHEKDKLRGAYEAHILQKTNLINAYVKWADAEIARLRGAPPPPQQDPGTPLIAADADLSALPLLLLEAEMTRLEGLISADRDIQRRYSELTQKITIETAALEAAKERLKEAQGAADRIKALDLERDAAYQRAFAALVAEQTVLEDLYRPLMERLASSPGTLKKLTFSVSRVADVERWASAAEEGLLDLRKQGPSGPHPAGSLPPITYMSGGLENQTIRKTVCDILEGGEFAFKERARRLRVRLRR